MIVEGDYECEICGERFETNVAIAGHTQIHSRAATKEEVIEALQKLAEEKGRTPTVAEMDEEGELTSTPVNRLYGSWREGVLAAGLTPRDPRSVTKSDILAEIRRLAEDLGRTPTSLEMKEQGRISVPSARRYFGSWNEAVKAAGLTPNIQYGRSPEELLEILHDMADKLGRPPTAYEMDNRGPVSTKMFQQRFGTWNDAIRAAGYSVHCPKDIPDSDLVAEIDRLKSRLGRVPSSADMVRYGNHALFTYTKRYGSWAGAIESAGYEYRDPSPTGETDGSSGWTGSYGPNWSAEREARIEYDDAECVMPDCPITREHHRNLFSCDLNVHHVIPIREFVNEEGDLDHERANRLSNLVTLCVRHHQQWEELSPLRPDIRK